MHSQINRRAPAVEPKPNHREYRTTNEDGSPIRVTLEDGRVAVVGDEWRDLPLDFHNKAIRSGCEARIKPGHAGSTRVDANAGPTPSQAPAPPRVGTDEAVRNALIAAINDDPPDLFNEGTGKPEVKIIEKYAGFTIPQEQFSRVWAALHEDLKKAQDDAEAAEEAHLRQEGAAIAAENAERTSNADADANDLDPEPKDAAAVTVDANLLDKQRQERQRKVGKAAKKAVRKAKGPKPAAGA